MHPAPRYLSFMLRVANERGPNAPHDAWHADVEQVQTGEQWHFDEFEMMFEFLRHYVEGGGRTGAADGNQV